jgi:hypothetical protein
MPDGESAFVVRVLEVLPNEADPRDAHAAELRWQSHFARLDRLYNAPKCVMCGRPFPIDAPEAGTVDRPRKADRGKRRRVASEVAAEALDAKPSMVPTS